MTKRLAAVILAAVLVFVLVSCARVPEPEETEKIDTVFLLSAEGASVRMADKETDSDAVDESGVLLTGSGETYTGAFNAVFAGNIEIAFGFCRNEPSAYRRFTFTFTSVQDRSRAFSVVYESVQADWTGEAAGRGRSGVYVQWENEVRTTRYWQYENREEAWQNNDNFNLDEALAAPMFGGTGQYVEQYGVLTGSLSLAWTMNGVLEISACERNLEYSPRVIAAFDGTAKIGFDPVAGLWGLPMMDLSAGYTVSFRTETFGGTLGAPKAPSVFFSGITIGTGGQGKTYSLAEPEMERPSFYRAKEESKDLHA